MRKYILIILLFLLIVAVFLHFQIKIKIMALNKNLNKQEELIRQYQDKSGLIPGALVVTQLEKANSLGDKELKKMTAIFDSKKKELPADVSDKGIYFFESLHSTMKTLERKATLKKMILPPVDFSVDIPQEEDIPYLLKQIEMIDDIMGIIIETGKCEAETIRPMPIDKTKKILDFNKLSIQIALKIDSDSFVKVLSQLNSHVPLYLIEELTCSSIDLNRLHVNLVVSRILTGLSLEDVAEFKNTELFDLNSLYPLDKDFKSFGKRNPFFRYREAVKNASSPDSTKEASSVPQFTYKGNIHMTDKLVGIIEDNWQGKTCFVEAGDACSGYKVFNIEEKKAILSKDGQEIILLKGANNE